MKGTDQKILRAARILFNAEGVANISQRTICDHIAISPGNLTYHFKKRDDIIEALYFELADELSDIIDQSAKNEPSLAELQSFTKSMNKVFFENRFFMIDFIHILRANKKIKKHYTGISQRRLDYLKTFVEHMIKSGLMREEEIPDEFEHLYQRSILFGDFWIASIGTTTEEVMLKHTRSYTTMYLQSFYPYLTAKGKALFLKLDN